MIKAVIFDLDDTLYDYEYSHERAMLILRDYCVKKFSISVEYFENSFNKAKDIVKEQLGNVGASHNRMLYMQKFLEIIGEKSSVYALELYNQYWNAMLETIETFDYVMPLFQKLNNLEIKIAILTDLTAHIQYRKIKHLGIAEYIDMIVTSEEAGREKPDKKMFDLIIKKLSLKPHQMIMIGDSYRKDILGAEAAGIHGILYDKKEDNVIIKQCLEMIKIESEKE
ncbi:HAD family hydrolase [Velocimicrobium porci]|uniref:HAD family hydrolase n=1 Tax=Velocimicrobium porci TaxID=2606634 RepID=A0A6L5Y2B7_9FIRM|nr:HAD family hydrolase [Velocimicrobium porci]MSS64508.1 HAD family hydrolase [Velocimicrobium porci]